MCPLSRSFRRLGAELKNTADETPFLELARRGYDLSKLRDNDETETPAEILMSGKAIGAFLLYTAFRSSMKSSDR